MRKRGTRWRHRHECGRSRAPSGRIRAIHLGLLRASIERYGACTSSRLRSFVEPDLCLVEVTPNPASPASTIRREHHFDAGAAARAVPQLDGRTVAAGDPQHWRQTEPRSTARARHVLDPHVAIGGKAHRCAQDLAARSCARRSDVSIMQAMMVTADSAYRARTPVWIADDLAPLRDACVSEQNDVPMMTCCVMSQFRKVAST